MAGTLIGGRKAHATVLERFSEDWVRERNSKGGSAKTSKPKGFAAFSREQRQAAGRKGGANGRKGFVRDANGRFIPKELKLGTPEFVEAVKELSGEPVPKLRPLWNWQLWVAIGVFLALLAYKIGRYGIL